MDDEFSAWDGRKLPDYSWQYGRYLRWEPKTFFYYQRGILKVSVPVEWDAEGRTTKVSCPSLIVSDFRSRRQTRIDDSLRSVDTQLDQAVAPKHLRLHPDLAPE